jgi:hypothetical protein
LAVDGGVVGLWFDTTGDEVYGIGDRLYDLHVSAYMTGYNWARLVDYFIDSRDPGVRAGMRVDARPGGFTALWEDTAANRARAERLAGLIREVVSDPEALCRFVVEEPDAVDWEG